MKIMSQNSQPLGHVDRRLEMIEKNIFEYRKHLKHGFFTIDENLYKLLIKILKVKKPSSVLIGEYEKRQIYIHDKNFKLSRYFNHKESELNFVLKPKGVEVKLKYEYGRLKSAHAIDFVYRGLDITEIVKALYGDNNAFLEDIKDITLVGTFVLPYINLEVAKKIYNIENSYSGAYHIFNDIKNKIDTNIDSTSIVDLADSNLLMFVCTNIYAKEVENKNIMEKMRFIENFEIITSKTLVKKIKKENLNKKIDKVLYLFETQFGSEEYPNEGILVFETGVSKKEIILKLKKWRDLFPIKKIKSIEWVDEKGYKKPIFKLEGDTLKDIKLDSIKQYILLNKSVGDNIEIAFEETLGFFSPELIRNGVFLS